MSRFALATLALCAAACDCGGPIVGHVDAALTTTGEFPSAAAQLVFQGGFTDAQQAFRTAVQGQGADPQQIKSARMKSFKMTVTQPAPEDPSYRGLSFLTSLRLKFRAPGLADVVAAHREDFATPAGSPTPQIYDLAVDASVELQPYLTASVITVIIEADGALPPTSTFARADMVLDVGAVLLNGGGTGG